MGHTTLPVSTRDLRTCLPGPNGWALTLSPTPWKEGVDRGEPWQGPWARPTWTEVVCQRQTPPPSFSLGTDPSWFHVCGCPCPGHCSQKPWTYLRRAMPS